MISEKAEWSRISRQLPPDVPRCQMRGTGLLAGSFSMATGAMGLACHVSACGCGSAGGRDQRRNRGSLSVSRTGSPRPIGMRGTGRWRWMRGLPVLLARSSGSCLPGAISSRPGPDPRIRPAGRARKHRRADLLLPASQATGLPSCCLCTNMWITCAQRRRACAYAVEMLGIPLPGRNHDRAFTWESASRTLCMQRKRELSTCHAAIDN